MDLDVLRRCLMKDECTKKEEPENRPLPKKIKLLNQNYQFPDPESTVGIFCVMV
jgi:hypothetical protein